MLRVSLRRQWGRRSAPILQTRLESAFFANRPLLLLLLHPGIGQFTANGIDIGAVYQFEILPGARRAEFFSLVIHLGRATQVLASTEPSLVHDAQRVVGLGQEAGCHFQVVWLERKWCPRGLLEIIKGQRIILLGTLSALIHIAEPG